MNKLLDLNNSSPEREKVIKFLERYLDMPAAQDHVLFMNGADAAIHLLIGLVFRGKSVLFSDLNYPYATRLIKQFTESKEFETSKDNARGVRKIPVSFKADADIIYITNPDNILGLVIEPEKILRIATKFPTRAVIIDESYIDFCPKYSIAGTDLPKNVIVVRTFSKFFEQESERIAYMIAGSDYVEKIRKCLPQYPIAASSINAVVNVNMKKEGRSHIRRLREAALQRLKARELQTIRSATNFISLSEQDVPSGLVAFPHKRVVWKDKVFLRFALSDEFVNAIESS